jgi:collagenase-like PrtC family protease
VFAIVLRHRLLAWCNLVRELAALEAMGVGRYRLSPQDVDMVAVARTFRGVLDGRLDARAGFAALAELAHGAPFSNGFYHGIEGVRLVEPAPE